MRPSFGRPQAVVVASALAFGLVVGCGGSPASESAPSTSLAFAPVAAGEPTFLRRPVDREAPAFTLQDSTGSLVSLGDYRGKWVLIDWVFTNCVTFCPLLTRDMKAVHGGLGSLAGDQVQLVTITFDPTRDTPEATAAFAAFSGGNVPGWSWLTGTLEETDAVAASYGVSYRPTEPVGGVDQFDHTALMVVVGPDGRETTRYLGYGWSDDVLELIGAEIAGAPAPEAPVQVTTQSPDIALLASEAIALPWEDWELTNGVLSQVLYQFPNVGSRASFVDALLTAAGDRGIEVTRMDLAAMRIQLIPGAGEAFTALGYTENLVVVVEGESRTAALNALQELDNDWCCTAPG
jgi:cytochrome oxidase Cu insertion factor (SCO1/SenC/PrrC family)